MTFIDLLMPVMDGFDLVHPFWQREFQQGRPWPQMIRYVLQP